MEQILDIQTSTQKIYRDKAIWVGTFLGGPLAAGYLIAENFKAFNDPAKVKRHGFMQFLPQLLYLVVYF